MFVVEASESSPTRGAKDWNEHKGHTEMSKITVILSAIMLFAFVAACAPASISPPPPPPPASSPTITLIDSRGESPDDVAVFVSGAKPNDYIELSINGLNRLNPAGKWANANGSAKWDGTERLRIFGCEGDQTVVTATVGGPHVGAVSISATHTITAPPCDTPVVPSPGIPTKTPADSKGTPTVAPATPVVPTATPDLSGVFPTTVPIEPTVVPAEPTVVPAAPTEVPAAPTAAPAVQAVTPRYTGAQNHLVLDSEDSGTFVYEVMIGDQFGEPVEGVTAVGEYHTPMISSSLHEISNSDGILTIEMPYDGAEGYFSMYIDELILDGQSFVVDESSLDGSLYLSQDVFQDRGNPPTPTITLNPSSGPDLTMASVTVSNALIDEPITLVTPGAVPSPVGSGKTADAHGNAVWDGTEKIEFRGCKDDQTTIQAIVGGTDTPVRTVEAVFTITAPACLLPITEGSYIDDIIDVEYENEDEYVAGFLVSVTGPDGAYVAGAQVEAWMYTPQGSEFLIAETDSEGLAEFSYLDPESGLYELEIANVTNVPGGYFLAGSVTTASLQAAGSVMAGGDNVLFLPDQGPSGTTVGARIDSAQRSAEWIISLGGSVIKKGRTSNYVSLVTFTVTGCVPPPLTEITLIYQVSIGQQYGNIIYDVPFTLTGPPCPTAVSTPTVEGAEVYWEVDENDDLGNELVVFNVYVADDQGNPYAGIGVSGVESNPFGQGSFDAITDDNGMAQIDLRTYGFAGIYQLDIYELIVDGEGFIADPYSESGVITLAAEYLPLVPLSLEEVI